MHAWSFIQSPSVIDGAHAYTKGLRRTTRNETAGKTAGITLIRKLPVMTGARDNTSDLCEILQRPRREKGHRSVAGIPQSLEGLNAIFLPSIQHHHISGGELGIPQWNSDSLVLAV